MKTAVITFPASNCNRDAIVTLQKFSSKVNNIWHTESKLDNDYDLIILPGGFSYGDYLRSGAMAAISPVIQEVKRLASRGVKILGICNGFQILTEAGLLPGVLLRNEKLAEIVNTKEITLVSIDLKRWYSLKSSNDLLFENPSVYGVKTGYTESAGQCLILAYKKGDRDFMITILGSQDRFTDGEAIINWIQSNY